MKPRSVEVEYTETFLRSFSRLPIDIQEKARVREAIFRANAFDPRLRTHKLHGRDSEHWAFWVDNRHRIKFLFATDIIVVYLKIGTHDEVY